MSPCPHNILFIGAHDGFRRGWMCGDCGAFIKDLDLRGYGVVMAAHKTSTLNHKEQTDALQERTRSKER